MKKLVTLLTLGGLLSASTLQAQVEFYITGATAFRANAYRSIRNMFGELPIPMAQNRTWSPQCLPTCSMIWASLPM